MPRYAIFKCCICHRARVRPALKNVPRELRYTDPCTAVKIAEALSSRHRQYITIIALVVSCFRQRFFFISHVQFCVCVFCLVCIILPYAICLRSVFLVFLSALLCSRDSVADPVCTGSSWRSPDPLVGWGGGTRSNSRRAFMSLRNRVLHDRSSRIIRHTSNRYAGPYIIRVVCGHWRYIRRLVGMSTA